MSEIDRHGYMSEENFPEFLESIDPGVAERIGEFNKCRRAFYDWMSVQTIELPVFEDVVNTVTDKLQHTASLFAASSAYVSRVIQDRRIAEEIITRNWVCDDFERVVFFSQLLPEADFHPINRLCVSKEVEAVLLDITDDTDLENTLGYMYFDTLKEDVSLFFSGLNYRRQLSSRKFGFKMASANESPTYLEPSVPYLSALSDRYGSIALTRLIQTSGDIE